MGGRISCPKCGSDDVVCTEDPHNHECRACGYSMLGGTSTLPNLQAVDPALRARLENDGATNGRTLSQTMKFLLEQAVGLRPPPAPGPIPEVLSNEDGDTWWAKGHVDPIAMVLGAVLDQVVNMGPEEAAELLTGFAPTEDAQRENAAGLVAKVRHVWMVQDPDNEERMLEVAPDLEGAEAWTRLTL